MVIDFNPVLVSIGPLAVRWVGVLAVAGLGVAIWLSLHQLWHRRPDRDVALAALAWGLPAGLLSARLVYVLGYWNYFLTSSNELWQLNIAGLSLWGGLVGGGLIFAARLRVKGPRRRRILDAIAPYAALGIAIGRLGQFVDGQGQGLASTLPWATQYANHLAASPDFGVARQPAQLYDALVALALFALLKVLPRSMPAGTRLATFLFVYGLGRIIIGQVRLDPAFLFGLQIEQLLAIGCVMFGVGYGLYAVLGSSSAHDASRESNQAQVAHPKEDTLAA
ncbi:MAG: prolipoprotein diacylglyceryl transferase [Chloroflexi bacterium]|nr:prolipoprotein diacylglyceryl transferase [Chloroflexota bacterium]